MRTATLLISAVMILVCSFVMGAAQTEDRLADDSADPVKLFEQGQTAHSRGDLQRALSYYQEAIKVRPEFPEAEFQMGNVLVTLDRQAEAESAFRRAIQLRKAWSLPYSALGALLTRANRDSDAEPLLREALRIDSKDNVALIALANIRLRAGDPKESLRLAVAATNNAEASPSIWLLRAIAERASGDRAAARASLNHVLQVDPENVGALVERAELQIEDGDYKSGIDDLELAARIKKADKQILGKLANAYEKAGKPDEARRIAESAGLAIAESPDGKGNVIGSPEDIEAANSEDPNIARPALNKLLEKNPRNATLLARLGASYRFDDPRRSLEFYRQASEIKPDNPEYATGFAAALVRERRFGEAVGILRRVIGAFPDYQTAHANLATALYELKRYAEAIPEFEWLLKNKPELVIAHYYIGISRDNLREYENALTAYEAFLSGADSKTNQLEIEKVKLRLPLLRRQVQLGQGVKRKPQ